MQLYILAVRGLARQFKVIGLLISDIHALQIYRGQQMGQSPITMDRAALKIFIVFVTVYAVAKSW
jgi:hypothetical protein